MQNLKEVVKKLLDEAEGDVCCSYFFQSEATNNEDAGKYWGCEVLEFTEACRSELINYEHKDNHGGEGEGDQYWSVYSFTNGTDVVYVKFNGWYASYSGSEFTEWFFVEPKKVEVVQYAAA